MLNEHIARVQEVDFSPDGGFLVSGSDDKTAIVYDATTLTDVAGALSLDTAAFTSCLEAGTFRNEVQKATDVAQSLGVVATPTFLINGRVVTGAQPFEAFQRIIEAELAAAGNP